MQMYCVRCRRKVRVPDDRVSHVQKGKSLMITGPCPGCKKDVWQIMGRANKGGARRSSSRKRRS